MFDTVTTPDLARRLSTSTHAANADPLRTRQTLKEAASRLVKLDAKVTEQAQTIAEQAEVVQDLRERLDAATTPKAPAKLR